MDEFLDRAWRRTVRPFDGETLHLPELVGLEALQVMLEGVVRGLRARLGESELRSLDCWHEHDGFVSISQVATWNELAAAVSSPAVLYERRAADEYVRRGYYALDGAFYLRIWVPDEEAAAGEPPRRVGDFDLSGPRELVRSLPVEGARILPARRYFDEAYGG